jgi:SAM-dependent methyltransferase
MLPLVARYARRGGSLLDVGCGSGTLLAGAARVVEFGRLCGLDLSELPLVQARRACPAASFVVGDICQAPLSERFELITCMMTLDLVPDEARASEHVASMLTPGGHLIVVVQHLEKYRSALDERYGVRRHDRDSLRLQFERHGLREVESFNWGWPLFDVYYRLLDKSGAGVVAPRNAPSPLRRLASQGVYAALRVDDLFMRFGRGRVLFGVFQKPPASGGHSGGGAI